MEKHISLQKWSTSTLLMFSVLLMSLSICGVARAAVIVTTAPTAVVRVPVVVTPKYYGYGYHHGYVNTGKTVYRGTNYYNGYRGNAYHGKTVYHNGNVYHSSTYRR